MTLAVIMELVQLAIDAANALIKGNPTDLEQSLLNLVMKGNAAYEAQVGRPIDPSLIRPIDPIP